ncbi:MAG: zinc metalloprotease HtpX [Bryobacteraceae bacterium]|nr:zinc metalloprotease HtpX [Bryobacteraceae bacterium]
MNAIKTAILLGSLSGLLILAGRIAGGQQGMTIALVIAVGMNFFSYFFSEKMALSSSGAVRVSESENAAIFARIGPMTAQLCQRMGLPMPKLWVLPEASPNAFATGRNPSHSSVAVSAGLLDLMSDREVEAVIAHELGHIKNRDILTGSIAATIATAISYMGNMLMFMGPRHHDDDEDSGGGGIVGALAMMILAPMAAMVIQMAISRTREFSADYAAAKFTGSPEGLISGLGKLETWSQRIPMESSTPAMSHMYIIPPMAGQWFAKLFSTHPPTQERIARLASYRGQAL